MAGILFLFISSGRLLPRSKPLEYEPRFLLLLSFFGCFSFLNLPPVAFLHHLDLPFLNVVSCSLLTSTLSYPMVVLYPVASFRPFFCFVGLKDVLFFRRWISLFLPILSLPTAYLLRAHGLSHRLLYPCFTSSFLRIYYTTLPVRGSFALLPMLLSLPLSILFSFYVFIVGYYITSKTPFHKTTDFLSFIPPFYFSVSFLFHKTKSE